MSKRMSAHRMMLFGSTSRGAIAVSSIAVEHIRPDAVWADRQAYNRFPASTGRDLLPDPAEATAAEVAP